MLLSYLSENMDEYNNEVYPNVLMESSFCTEMKPTGDETVLLNISGDDPVLVTDNPNSNLDQLLRIIENQEKQNEKMLIQFKLKQVLLDYLKAKQSSTSTPSLCSQSNHLNITGDESSKSYSTFTTPSPPISPEIRSQLYGFESIQMPNVSMQTNTSDISLMTMSSNFEPFNDQSEESFEMNASSDSETVDSNSDRISTKNVNSSKKCNNVSKQMQKRSAHLSAEFRYRTKLNDKITKLRNIVGPKSQLSKSGVLGRSIDLINKLQKSNNKLKEENNKMRILCTQLCNQIPHNNRINT